MSIPRPAYPYLVFSAVALAAIFLIAPGNEIAGPLLVSLWAQSSMDLVSALSVIIIAILGTGASYCQILVTEGIRRQRLELAI